MKFVVAITGASGVVYAQRLVEMLCKNGHEICLIISEAGRLVLETELNWTLTGTQKEIQEQLQTRFSTEQLQYYPPQDISAPVASGSWKAQGMIIIPCSMGTLSRVAHGSSTNLIERAADVFIKEKRPLILAPRETPLSAIHLQNMLILANLGVHIVPAMPAFYYNPQSISDLVDFFIGKVFDLFHLEHQLFKPWSGGL